MRLLFEKEGVAIWSSHLDLMRVLMRSFRRAGIALKHSQGFTPHPELSILLPLSVGVESECEIAEFALAEGCTIPAAEIAPRLAPVLPAGLRALESWEGGQKAGKLAWLRARLVLTYDQAVGAHSVRPHRVADSEMQNERTEEIVTALQEFFGRESLVVEKHGKKGPVELDIAPMIREVTVGAAGMQNDSEGGSVIAIEAVVAAQNPTLNPLLLATAIETWLPEYKPDHVQCRRLAVYDAEGTPFR